jgi:TetR/AcrR family transcriptional regulator
MVPEPTRRERERARHRSEILASAEALFQERGVEGTTMEDIAKKSEFAVGTLYRFFASKTELVEALVFERVRAHAQRVSAIAASAPSYSAALDEVLELHAQQFTSWLPLLMFMFSGKFDLGPDPTQSPLCGCVFDINAAMAELLDRGRREGVLDGDPHTMAIVLGALLDGFGRQALLTGSPDVRPMMPLVRSAFHDGFRRRVAPA